MRNSLATIAATICTILFLSTGPRGTALAATLELGIDEEMFTVNGTPQFLVFVSYFDAMDVSATNLHSDFAYLRSKGVDGVRIFPNWWDVQQDASKRFSHQVQVSAGHSEAGGPAR
jgi:hypothetical protein